MIYSYNNSKREIKVNPFLLTFNKITKDYNKKTHFFWKKMLD